MQERLPKSSGLFAGLTIFCVAFPGLPIVKAGCIIGTWLYFFAKTRFKISSAIWLCSVLLSLALWSVISLLYDVPKNDLLNQLSRFALFFLVLSIGVYVVQSGRLGGVALDALIARVSAFSVFLKLGIMAGIISGWFSLETIQNAVGFETVTDDIGLGIQRLQFPSDIAVIFLLSCYVGGRNRMKDSLLLLSITIIVFLSFSRYLFAAYLFCIFVRSLWLRRLDVISWTSIVIVAVLCAVFFASISNRFGGEGSNLSDDIRGEQIRYLGQTVSEHAVFGTGLGSSVKGYTRSETLPFSYEVQWYAMAMQLGFVGLTWFFVNLLSALSLSVRTAKAGFFFFLIFGLWVLAGFTNPFITSLGSAFGFCILMLRVTQDESSRSKETDVNSSGDKRTPSSKPLLT